MRRKGSAAELEVRRKRALQWYDSGLSLHEVGRRVGCAPISVQRWRDARDRHGADGLKVGRSPGRPRKLSPRQERQLLRLLIQGPTAHGFGSALWTTKRVVELIERHFGVGYHHDHIGRLLHRLGWSVQRPERRARERDEEAIDQWLGREWPRVKIAPRA
jgi:transposase